MSNPPFPYTTLSEGRALLLHVLLSNCPACAWVCDGRSALPQMAYIHQHELTCYYITILIGRPADNPAFNHSYRVFVTDKETFCTEIWNLPFGTSSTLATGTAVM